MKRLDSRVAWAMAIMDRHLAKPISVKELARAVNLSPSYLTRLFHTHLGCSPAHYDRVQRLDRAYELMMTSFLSVKEVMASVGWNDPSHFSRDFRARFGLSPRAVRDSVAAERLAMDQHALPPTEASIGQEYAGPRRRRGE
jgi:transcriptional regulator GlxA family with amidase domain